MTQDLIMDYDAKMVYTTVSSMDVETGTASVFKLVQDYNTVSDA